MDEINMIALRDDIEEVRDLTNAILMRLPEAKLPDLADLIGEDDGLES